MNAEVISKNIATFILNALLVNMDQPRNNIVVNFTAFYLYFHETDILFSYLAKPN